MENTDRPAGLVPDPAERADLGPRGLRLRRAAPPRAATCWPRRATDVILIGTGSEVQLAVKAREVLGGRGRRHPGGLDAVRRVVQRAGPGVPGERAAGGHAGPGVGRGGYRPGWRELVGDHGVSSAWSTSVRRPPTVLYQEFGITAEAVVAAAQGVRSPRPALRRHPASARPAAKHKAHRRKERGTMTDVLGSSARRACRSGSTTSAGSGCAAATWQALVRDLHVRRRDTNPTIFPNALAKGDAYDDQIKDLAIRGVTVEEAARMITTYDIRWGADVLRPVYDAIDGVDGRVSIEVDPRLATRAARRRRGQAAVVAGGPARTCTSRSRRPQGRAGDHRDARRGHQRQRDADLLPGALRRGHRRLPDRSGAGQRERAGHVLDRVGGLVLRLPGGHRDRQAAGRHRTPRRARAPRRRSPTPGWPTSCTRSGSGRRPAGARWTATPAPSCSDRCGPPPVSRTRSCRTPCT